MRNQLIYQLYLYQIFGMQLDNPTQTVLYTIEQAIKEYRKFCQKNISDIIHSITVDQVLVLLALNNNPELSQHKIAAVVFKDNASITRMIELMVRNNFIKRTINKDDRRKYNLQITPHGRQVMTQLTPVITYNRSTALKGFTKTEIQQLDSLLTRIITNCKNQKK